MGIHFSCKLGEARGARWVSIFHVKSEQYNGFSRGLGVILGVEWEPIFIFTLKYSKIFVEREKELCNTCARPKSRSDQKPCDSPYISTLTTSRLDRLLGFCPHFETLQYI